ncbi:glycosyltransferase family 52 [Acinetobacter indicus]|uniref:glycosyltransferase family 52 n=1 Tax=Acinetobacter indicus TaxID=756892 RepID=UPI000948B32F|nr:glycosyltransferase family 52 [Acinetobacter indicus]
MVDGQQKSLIMCVTPLQMLIAEKIIHKFKDQKFDVIVVALADNEKYRYYYKKLEKISCNSFYYVPKDGFLGFLEYINVLKKNGFAGKYTNCFLASINSRHLQYIISKNKNTNIYTFDDGTANIIQNSIYYTNEKISSWKKLIWQCIGIKYYMNDIKKLSKKHYTLYEGVSNIIENTEFLNLFESLESGCEPIKKINIYLGQPLIEISDKFTEQYILKALDNLQIDYYFPHPREKLIPKGNFEIITTPLIFEDYIINFLKDNPNVRVEVYSFISSALLNVSSLLKVQCIYLYNDDFMMRYKDFYFFSKSKFNIKLKNVESI